MIVYMIVENNIQTTFSHAQLKHLHVLVQWYSSMRNPSSPHPILIELGLTTLQIHERISSVNGFFPQLYEFEITITNMS
jgi:hypothetical protein